MPPAGEIHDAESGDGRDKLVLGLKEELKALRRTIESIQQTRALPPVPVETKTCAAAAAVAPLGAEYAPLDAASDSITGDKGDVCLSDDDDMRDVIEADFGEARTTPKRGRTNGHVGADAGVDVPVIPQLTPRTDTQKAAYARKVR